MTVRRSAGLLLFRGCPDQASPADIEVLLGHPGGPFFARRDDGAWSILKGEYDSAEDPRAAADREFTEETGAPAPTGRHIDLGEVRLPSRKLLTVYAVESDFDPSLAHSNSFEMEWPPRSGQLRSFPEIDRVEWFDVTAARQKLSRGQGEFLDRLGAALNHV